MIRVCGYVSNNHENKRVENVFNQHDFGVEEMIFCCCGCSSYKNIDIGIDIEKKWQISSKYHIE
jgi:hypothetical protein